MKILILVLSFLSISFSVFAQVLDDEQKLQSIKDAINEEVENIQTLSEMETFLKGLTSNKLIDAITFKLQERADSYKDSSSHIDQMSDDLESLKADVEKYKGVIISGRGSAIGG